MSSTLEDLLRESKMTYGHMQLFRDDAGWHVSICHYRTSPPNHGNDDFTIGIFDDPVEGFIKALLEDDRRTRELERKYAASSKGSEFGEPKQIDLEEAIAAAPPPADPLAGMFG